MPTKQNRRRPAAKKPPKDDFKNSVFGLIADGDNGENYRGAVYQWPARDGTPVYVAGYRAGEYSRKTREWSDMSGDAAARLELRRLLYGDPDDHDASKRDAARQADGIAESAADSAREYNAAWQAGSRYAGLGEDVKSARREFLKLRLERKSMCAKLPAAIIGSRDAFGTLLTAIDDKAQALLKSIQTARSKREKLRDSIYRDTPRSAFNEGAGETVFPV